MGQAITEWIAGNRDIYIGNATATRDFRVQLRGNRSVILFGLYLVILIGVALIVYSGTSGSSSNAVVEAQSRLQSFYTMTMGLLGLAVCVVAPALTATSIVMERQRQSIDLVFSAPVTPKYYLVGKMISSFRYTWMLLVLALPVTAASVVLGGASWTDVLIAYILLSLQGLILTSFALLMSTVAPRPVGAIIWSYAATIIYNLFAFACAMSSVYPGLGRGKSDGEMSCFVALSPWTVSYAARTSTLIFGHLIPNWVLMFGYALLVTKLCLLGAGTLLSAGGGKEVIGLRIYGLVYTLTAACIAGWCAWPSMSVRPIFGSMERAPSSVVGATVAWITLPMFTFVPFLACFGFDRERRFRPNGIFSVRHLFDGTPGGGLPYLLAMMACIFVGFAGGAHFSAPPGVGQEYWTYALFATTFWTMLWAFGRFFSSIFPTMRMSRVLVFALFLVACVMPYPLLVAIAGPEPEPGPFSLWDIYLMGPMVGERDSVASHMFILIAVMTVVSLVLATVGEIRTRRKLAGIRNYDERPFQAA